MNFDYTSDYRNELYPESTFEKEDNEKHNYVIVYKINGSNKIIVGEDLCRNEIKDLFSKKFPTGEIIEMYSYREWSNKVGEEFARKAMKHFSRLEKFVEAKD